jgi:CBS domain-containing protein
MPTLTTQRRIPPHSLSPPVATHRIRRRAPGTGSVTVSAAVIAPQLQIGDDARIDQAMDILRSAGADHLLIRADDGRCGGMLTPDHLRRYRDDIWYTEGIRVRDIIHDTAPFDGADTPADVALAGMRARGLTMAPVVDDDGYAVGIVTAERLRGLLTAGATRPSRRAVAPC